MKYVLILFVLFLSACEDDASSDVDIAITPDQPLVIMSSTVEQTITIVDGEIEIGLQEVPAPWADVGFKMANNHNKVITIAAVTFYITGPDGQTRTRSVLTFNSDGDPLGYFSELRPEKDANCDGEVSEAEAAVENPVLVQPCSFDQHNASFNQRRLKISDFLDGVENIEIYAGSSYNIRVRFEGWIGPHNAPELNFMKEIFLSAQSNF